MPSTRSSRQCESLIHDQDELFDDKNLALDEEIDTVRALSNLRPRPQCLRLRIAQSIAGLGRDKTPSSHIPTRTGSTVPAQVVGSEVMGCNGKAETATMTVLMAKDEEIIARVVNMRAGGDWAHSGMPRIAPYMPMQLLRRARDLIECVHDEPNPLGTRLPRALYLARPDERVLLAQEDAGRTTRFKPAGCYGMHRVRHVVGHQDAVAAQRRPKQGPELDR